jgi:hypothetical protein
MKRHTAKLGQVLTYTGPTYQPEDFGIKHPFRTVKKARRLDRGMPVVVLSLTLMNQDEVWVKAMDDHPDVHPSSSLFQISYKGAWRIPYDLLSFDKPTVRSHL